MTAAEIVTLLSDKHLGDVFVPECKNGPTQQAKHRRLDAWVLRKTWSPITTIGYEVKVSRSDWRRDQKLDEYAGLCHLFSVVAPKGVVPLEELPNGVGLIEVVGEQRRLVTRRKAPRREIEIPVGLLVYVLMCRTRITRDHDPETADGARASRVRHLREWAESKDERRALHWALSAKIRGQFDDQERAIADTERRINDLKHIEQRIRELGFNPREQIRSWDVSKRLTQLGRVVHPRVLHDLERLSKDVDRVRRQLEELVEVPSDTDEVSA